MQFEPYTARWQDQVNCLATRVFGTGYFARPSEIAAEPGSLLLVCHGDDGLLRGFSQGRLLPPLSVRGYLEHRVSSVPPEISEGDRTGTLGAIEAIAVAPGHRGDGVGTSLLRILHDRLVGWGADKLIVSFKRGPGATEVDGLMDRLGFTQWTRLPSFWRDRCESGEFECADRSDRCGCEALLYRKAIY